LPAFDDHRVSPRGEDREDQLFSAPLPTPTPRLYRELGVQPDASSDEVAWAKVSASARLRREQAGLEQALDTLEAEVGGLRDAAERLRRLRGAEQPAADELLDAERTLARLEIEAFAVDPLFRDKRRRLAEVQQTILELAGGGLDEPGKRLEYDRAHPPLAILKLEECAEGAFEDPRTCLFLLHTTLASFLAGQGERVYHPSDLTREDFSADFDHNELLDGPAVSDPGNEERGP
jgi:hypothetical protein